MATTGTTMIKFALKDPPAIPPAGFAINNPPRIAFDFPNTANGLGTDQHDLGEGDCAASTSFRRGIERAWWSSWASR